MASHESVLLLWSLFILSLRLQTASTVGDTGTARQWSPLVTRGGCQGAAGRVSRDYPPPPQVAITQMRHVTCLCRWFPYWYLCCDRKIVINHFEFLPHYNEVFPRLRIPDNEVAFPPSSSASSDPPDLPTYRQALGFVSLRNQWQTRNGGKANDRELSGTKTGVTLYLPVSRAKPWSQQQGGLPLSPSIDSHHDLLRPLVADTAASSSSSREMWLYPTPSYTLSDTPSYTSTILPQLTPSNASTTKLLSVAAPSNADIILSHTTPRNTLSVTTSNILSDTAPSNILSDTTPSNTLSDTTSNILSDTTPSNANDKETLSDTGSNNARGKKTLWSTQTITSYHETLYDRTHSNTLEMGSPSNYTQISTRNIELSTPSKTMLSDTTTRSFTLSQTVPLTYVTEEIRPHLAPGSTRNTGLATGKTPSNQDTLSRGSPGNTSNIEILSGVLDLTSGTALCHQRKKGIAADVGDTKEGSSPGPNTQSSNTFQSLDITEIPVVHESLTMVSNRSKSATGLLKAATPSTLGQHQLPDSAVFSGFQEKNNILLELKSSFLARNSVTYEDIMLEEISTAFIANKVLESVKIQPSPLTISFQTPAPAIHSETVTADRPDPLSNLSPTSDLLTSLVSTADTINPSFAFATMAIIPATSAFDTWRTKDVYHHHRNLEDIKYNSRGDDSLNYRMGEHNLNGGPLTSRLEDSAPQPSDASIVSLTSSSVLEEQKETSVLPTPSFLLTKQLSSSSILTAIVGNLHPIFIVSKQTKLPNSMEHLQESEELASSNIVAPNLSDRREMFVFSSSLSQGPATSATTLLNEPTPPSGSEILRENSQLRVSLVTTGITLTDDSEASSSVLPVLTGLQQEVSSADPSPSGTVRSDHGWPIEHTGKNTSTGTPLVPPPGVTVSQWITGTTDTPGAAKGGNHGVSYTGADDHEDQQVKSARRSERPASEAGQPTSERQHVTHEGSTSPAVSSTSHPSVDKSLPARQSHTLKVGAAIGVGLMCLSLVVMVIVHRSRRRERGRDGLLRDGRLLLQRDDNIRHCLLRAPRWYPGYSRGGAAQGDWQRTTTRN